MFIYFERERERASMSWGRGREKGRERIPSRLCTASMGHIEGLKLTKHKIMT